MAERKDHQGVKGLRPVLKKGSEVVVNYGLCHHSRTKNPTTEGPPNCKAQCVPGKYGLHECIYNCIVAGYDYGTCNPNPTGKCCCAYEGHDR
ncbi:unnamed protein product [Brassica rapa subsp. narinosa]